MAVTKFYPTSWAHVCLLLFVSAVCLATPVSKRDPDDILADTALTNVYKVLNGTLSDGSVKTTCTKANLAIRKE